MLGAGASLLCAGLNPVQSLNYCSTERDCMINEERLGDIRVNFENNTKAPIPKKDSLEIIQLARLGIWAEQYAIPLLEDSAKYECYDMCSCQDKAQAVLTKLPKAENPQHS